MNTGGFSSRCL